MDIVNLDALSNEQLNVMFCKAVALRQSYFNVDQLKWKALCDITDTIEKEMRKRLTQVKSELWCELLGL